MDTTAMTEILSGLHEKLRQERERATYHQRRAESLLTAIRELESLVESSDEDQKDDDTIAAAAGEQVGAQTAGTGGSSSSKSTKDLILDVLRSGGKWSNAELTTELEQRGWGEGVQNREETVRTAVIRLMKSTDTPVERVGRGLYAYRIPDSPLFDTDERPPGESTTASDPTRGGEGDDRPS